jgi:glycosyltransferase involved in cell wall biosynthesis
MQKPLLALVVPCYNEEAVLRETCKRLLSILNECTAADKISENSFIRFVDDGSSDDTWQIIADESSKSQRVTGLKLSRNFGHQNALLAGMMSISEKADCIISIDADLQQDEKCIPEFIDKYLEGYDIVFGVRKDRAKDNFFKRFFSVFFYKFMKLLGVNVLKNHADYRLISNRALNSLSGYTETSLFLRGIFPLLGYKSAVIYHDVFERHAGKTKYSYRKMMSLALNGVTSFSIVPMRIITIIGLLIFLVSVIMSAYVIITYITNNSMVGWASTVLPIYFIGGIQLLCVGVVGEYIGKIYMEVKKRPRYIIEAETKTFCNEHQK